MPMEFLITKLLRDKQMRDAATTRQDELFARDDERFERTQGLRESQERRLSEQAEFNRQRQERLDEQAAENTRFSRQQSLASMAANPNFQLFGEASGSGLGAMTADSMLRNSSRVLPDTAQSPTMDVGGSLFRVRPQAELQAQASAAENDRFSQVLNQLRQVGGVAQQAAEGSGRVVSRVGDDSFTLANPPRPAAPPTPTQGAITRQREDTAFDALRQFSDRPGRAAIDPVLGGGLSNLANLNTTQLLQLADTIASQSPTPVPPRTIFEMLLERQRAEARRQPASNPTGGDPGNTVDPDLLTEEQKAAMRARGLVP